MLFWEFLEGYKEGVKAKTGKGLSASAIAELTDVKQYNIQGYIRRKNAPTINEDRLKLKAFFGIDEFFDISKECLNDAIDRYPKGAAKVEDLKNVKAQQIPLGQQTDNKDLTNSELMNRKHDQDHVLAKGNNESSQDTQNKLPMEDRILTIFEKIATTQQSIAKAAADIAETNRILATAGVSMAGLNRKAKQILSKSEK